MLLPLLALVNRVIISYTSPTHSINRFADILHEHTRSENNLLDSTADSHEAHTKEAEAGVVVLLSSSSGSEYSSDSSPPRALYGPTTTR